MQIRADLHIHSKYSRATSPKMDIENLAKWSKIKGIDLIATGDFTHPLWFKELKDKLQPTEKGLYVYEGVNFILSAEVSSIYTKHGKCRRIHNLIYAPSLEVVVEINKAFSEIGNIKSDGRPILGLDAEKLVEIVMDISKDCMVVPAHAWTPWFSVFGSMSGFDTIEECFGKQSKHIYALETGLSSDPAMNWRLSALDDYTLISNSDSHSPLKIGRELNVFDTEMDYYKIMDVIKTKDKNKFLYTVEFFPEEGKYHYDGHRVCKVRFSPKETKAHNNICPVCRKPLTVGVMHRVDDLADREDGIVPANSIPFKKSISLLEIIAETLGVKGLTSKRVTKEYFDIINYFGKEFDVLLNIPKKDLKKKLPVKISEGILRVRDGNLNILPGYDGEYGTVKLFK